MLCPHPMSRTEHSRSQAQYRERRNTLVDNLLDVAHAGLEGRMTSETNTGELRLIDTTRRFVTDKAIYAPCVPLCSFVCPDGGMFGESTLLVLAFARRTPFDLSYR